MSERARTAIGWLVGLLPLLAIAVLYSPALRVGLLSDDYLFLFDGPPNLGTGLGGLLSTGHFIPAGAWLFYFQGLACGSDGGCHHEFTLFLFCGVALAVAGLGRLLGFPAWQASAAALLFATSSLPFELPLWATAALHASSLLVGLGALACFIEAGRSSRRLWTPLSAVLFLFALLLHEQTLGFLFAAAAWSVFGESVDYRRPTFEFLRRVALRPAFLRRLAPWFAVAGFWMALKLGLAHRGDQLPALARGVVSVVGGALYHALRTFTISLPSSWAWFLLRPPIPGGAILGPAVVVAVFAYVGWRLRAIEAFLAAWGLAQIALMCVASGMSSRHLAVPLVPASLLMAALLARATQSIEPRRKAALAFALAIGVLCGFGAWQVRYRVDAYLASSAWVERLFATAGAAIRADPRASRLVAWDLPDGVELGESEPAFALRYGFEAEILRRFPGRFDAVSRVRSTPPPRWSAAFGAPADADALGREVAAGTTLVLRCSGPSQSFEVWPAPVAALRASQRSSR